MRTIHGDEEEADTIQLNDFPASSHGNEVELHGRKAGDNKGYSSLIPNSGTPSSFDVITSSFNDVVHIIQVTFDNQENLLNLIKSLSFLTAALILTIFIIILVQGSPHSHPKATSIMWGVPTQSPTYAPGVQVPYDAVFAHTLRSVPTSYLYQISGCWQICYRAPFNQGFEYNNDKNVDDVLNSLSSMCSGDHLFIGSRDVAKDEFEIGAFGVKSSILATAHTPVASDSNNLVVSNSAVYWYNVVDSSGNVGIGFADYSSSSSTVSIPLNGVEDTALGNGCRDRLNIVFSSSSKTLVEGSANCLSFSSSDAVSGSQHEKIFMSNTCPL